MQITLQIRTHFHVDLNRWFESDYCLQKKRVLLYEAEFRKSS